MSKAQFNKIIVSAAKAALAVVTDDIENALPKGWRAEMTTGRWGLQIKNKYGRKMIVGLDQFPPRLQKAIYIAERYDETFGSVSKKFKSRKK